MARSLSLVLAMLVALSLAVPAPAQRRERVFVASATSMLPASEVVRKLEKRDAFARLGLEIAADPNDADYIVEVDRAVLTRFTFVLLDARTHALIARGQVSSLLGTASGRIADRVLRVLAEKRGHG